MKMLLLCVIIGAILLWLFLSYAFSHRITRFVDKKVSKFNENNQKSEGESKDE